MSSQEPPHTPLSRSILVRLPDDVLAGLKRQAAAHGVVLGEPVPTAEYARLVLAAHVRQAACPCNPLCSGG